MVLTYLVRGQIFSLDFSKNFESFWGPQKFLRLVDRNMTIAIELINSGSSCHLVLFHNFASTWQFLEPLIPSPAVGSPMHLRHASYKALVLCYRGNFWTPGAVASAKGHIGSGRRQRRAFLCRSSMQSATEVIVHSVFCKVTPLCTTCTCTVTDRAYSLLYCS